MADRHADDHVCYISSTIDPVDRTAACLMQWGPLQALLKPDVVLTTARDLMAAAAHAEADIALIKTFRKGFKTDPETVGHIVLDVRANRPAPTGKAALRIEAVAGVETVQPYVNIARGSMKRQMDPDVAREMALHWTEVAVAAQIDVRLRYALGEWDQLTPTEIDRLFGMMRAVQR